MDLNEMTKYQLEDLQCKKEDESQTTLKSNSILDDQILDLRKKIKIIELELIPLQQARKQGTHNEKRVNSELRNIKTYIYKRLRGE